jgi:putative transposase
VRSNRRANLDRTGNTPIAELPVAATGTVVHLEGFGLVKAFRIAAPDGHTEHLITDDLAMGNATHLKYSEWSWGIEEYHRGLKQFTEVERCPATQARSQRNHIGMSLRAFLRLEWHRVKQGVGWFEVKWGIVRNAVRPCRSNTHIAIFGNRLLGNSHMVI